MEKETEIIYLLSFLKKRWKPISLFVVGGMVVGLLLAILNPNEYRTEVSFLIERDNSLPSMGGLMGIAGLNLRSTNESISPDLYGTVLESPSFAFALQEKYFPTESGDTLTLSDFLIDRYKPTLRERITRTINRTRRLFSKTKTAETVETVIFDTDSPDNSLIKELSPEEQRIMNFVRKNISIQRDKATGLITLQVYHQDRFFSAGLVSYAFDYLKDALAESKVEKAKRKFEFIESQYDSAYQKFNEAHLRLANFRDRNMNVSSAMVRTQEEKLSLEFNQASSVINSLGVQREESRIAYEEQTPIFSVITPPILPVKSIKRPSTLVYVLIFAFLGFLFGFAYFFYGAHLSHLFKST